MSTFAEYRVVDRIFGLPVSAATQDEIEQRVAHEPFALQRREIEMTRNGHVPQPWRYVYSSRESAS